MFKIKLVTSMFAFLMMATVTTAAHAATNVGDGSGTVICGVEDYVNGTGGCTPSPGGGRGGGGGGGGGDTCRKPTSYAWCKTTRCTKPSLLEGLDCAIRGNCGADERYQSCLEGCRAENC